jgi:hypothetical protein
MPIDEYYSAFDHLMGPLMSMVPQCTTESVQHNSSLRSSLHTSLSWE